MRFVFDIDGTIFFSKVDRKGKYKLIDINKDLIKIINGLYNSDQHEIILHTGRHWNHLSRTRKQLKKYSVKYHTLIMGKPVADYYIDDKAMKPDEFLKLITMENNNENNI